MTFVMTWDNHPVVAISGWPWQENMMGSKDRGGKHTKTAATKDLKAKRREKKAKRSAADAKRDRAG